MAEAGGPGDLTVALQAARDGDDDAQRLLYERVYDELHRMASGRLRREGRKPTLLQTTELVNEAYLRLVGSGPGDWENRAHFFGAAVEAMRRILVEYARRRNAARRGGGQRAVTMSDVADGAPSLDLIALNEALDRLNAIRPRVAQVVGLRFFIGLTVQETADMLRVSPRTVDSDWKFASAWLRREVSGGPSTGSENPDAT